MKRLYAAIAALLVLASTTVTAWSQTTGTDAFGYTWRTSQDPNGPTYNWIDITTTGTQVQGLGDDNVLGPFPIPGGFTYYYSTYTQFYVGSNGYITFTPGVNISSGSVPPAGNGFLRFPSNDNKNNVIGPYLADLTFVNANNSPIDSARVLYEQRGSQTIISFINVAYWSRQGGANQTSGANTFQLILDQSDKSFKMQYQRMSGAPDNVYSAPRVVGFEDFTGTVGATISTTRPANGTAISVEFPATVPDFADVELSGIQTRLNQGILALPGQTTPVTAILRGTGSRSVTTPVVVTMRLFNDAGTALYTSQATLDSVSVNQTINLAFQAPVPGTIPPGIYQLVASLTSTSDQNPNNNSATVEYIVVSSSTTQPVVSYGYNNPVYDPSVPNGVDTQSGGIYLTPPTYPIAMIGVELDMGWVSGNNYADSALTYTVRVLNDNGPNGTPGTQIAQWTIDFSAKALADSVSPLNLSPQSSNVGKVGRHRLTLASPVPITQGGVYIGALTSDRNTRFYWNSLIRDVEPPFSNRMFEIPSGVWGIHRSNGEFDYAIRGLFSNPLLSTDRALVSVPAMRLAPNPSNGQAVFLTAPVKAGQSYKMSIATTTGQTVRESVMRSQETGDVRFEVPTQGLAKGVYLVRMGDGALAPVRLVVQ